MSVITLNNVGSPYGPMGLSSISINRNSAMHEADTKLATRASAAATVSHRTKPRWKRRTSICWRVFCGISKHEDRSPRLVWFLDSGSLVDVSWLCTMSTVQNLPKRAFSMLCASMPFMTRSNDQNSLLPKYRRSKAVVRAKTLKAARLTSKYNNYLWDFCSCIGFDSWDPQRWKRMKTNEKEVVE